MNDEVIGDILALSMMAAQLSAFCANMHARTLAPNNEETKRIRESIAVLIDSIDGIAEKYRAVIDGTEGGRR